MRSELRNPKEGGFISAFLCFILGLCLWLSLGACSRSEPTTGTDSPNAEVSAVTRLEGPSMGTLWHATVIAAPADLALGKIIQAALDRVDQRMSTYKSDSELSLFNRASDEFKGFSPATLEVLRFALDLAHRSEGAFDPTVMPLIELWGFGPKPADQAPDEVALNQVMQIIGWQNLSFNATGQVQKAKPGVRVDLSAIAKGYGVDQVFLALREAGCTDFMIEVGGEIRTSGGNAEGLPWRIGIDRPIFDRSGQLHQVQDVMGVQDLAVATSGDYRNYREQNGRRISHIVDPRSGRPVSHKLASVTVLAPTCMQADALATTLSVLGAEAGMRFLADIPGVEAYFILRDGQTFGSQETAGFAAYRVAAEAK